MNREQSLQRVHHRTAPWDLLVIGGGATGIGIALDAASRGLDVVLLEQSDFGKGTSSRSTKLVHGGVRYLRQGNLTLVRDALRERTLLREHAPHLVNDLAFLIPCRSRWEQMFYQVGLKLYDILATRNSFGRSHSVTPEESVRRVPVLRPDNLAGGVVYHDGQFDDSRLLISMARTANKYGAALLNYCAVTRLVHDDKGVLTGVEAQDQETGETLKITSRAVVNAAGPFCDAVRHLDDPASGDLIAASQGVHLVLPQHFFPGDTAVIVPKTADGRVIFIIPWHQHVLVGTTDVPITEVSLEPTATREEIEFLLATTAEYLVNVPTVDDVLSVFTGIRPLVKGDPSARTASLSRDHLIRVSPSGLITIIGGKWTTVRKMAEDCVDRVLTETGMSASTCQTDTLRLHGYVAHPTGDAWRDVYGSEIAAIERLEAESPELAKQLDDRLPIRASEVVWAVRYDMARTVDDVLARRTRALFLNVDAALAMAPRVAELMAGELRRDDAWQQSQWQNFQAIAKHFRVSERSR